MGIEIAKANGKYKGRKPIDKPEKFDLVIFIWEKGDITAREAISQLNIKTNTFYRMVKRYSK